WQRLRREPDRRERFRAVDGIDLRVESGEIFGILGPNGAGKTTTMKMLATLLIPTSGAIRVLGIDPLERPREVRARLGVLLSGEMSVCWRLTARENLEYFAALYHVPPTETDQRSAGVLTAVKRTERAEDYVERYSTGMRQRPALARALLPDPPLIILDEPTVGLDPQASRDLRDRVRELRAQGRTVLLTTHYMEEADQLCDRVAIIDHGRIVALDTPAALKRTIRAEEVVHLEISLDGDESAVIDRLERSATVARSERSNGTLTVTAHCASARDFVPAAFDAARSAAATIRHVEVVPVTLEEVFLALTGRALRRGNGASAGAAAWDAGSRIRHTGFPTRAALRSGRWDAAADGSHVRKQFSRAPHLLRHLSTDRSSDPGRGHRGARDTRSLRDRRALRGERSSVRRGRSRRAADSRDVRSCLRDHIPRSDAAALGADLGEDPAADVHRRRYSKDPSARRHHRQCRRGCRDRARPRGGDRDTRRDGLPLPREERPPHWNAGAVLMGEVRAAFAIARK